MTERLRITDKNWDGAVLTSPLYERIEYRIEQVLFPNKYNIIFL